MGNNAFWYIGNKFESHTWVGDMSRLFGDHTIKFGGVFRLNRVSNHRPADPAGFYQFNTQLDSRAVQSRQPGEFRCQHSARIHERRPDPLRAGTVATDAVLRLLHPG